jgi:hypothetical protein
VIEITTRRGGTCEGCKNNVGDYSIENAPEEVWGLGSLWCEVCMLQLVRDNEFIRSVVLLQAATHRFVGGFASRGA